MCVVTCVIVCLIWLCNAVFLSIYVDALYTERRWSADKENHIAHGLNNGTRRWCFHQSLTIVYQQSFAHNTHGLLAAIVCVVIGFAHISDYRNVCRVSHTSCYIEPFLFSCLNTSSSSEWTACHISHTPWSGWPFLLCCLITSSSSEWTVCCISHTP